MKLTLPKIVRQIGKRFKEAGFQAYLVGGAVRNLIRNKKAADYDITTNATPEQVQSIFRVVIPTGIKHGTVTVIFRSVHFEITTFRSEGSYTDSRRPDDVDFVGDLESDLERRDFTINAIAADAVSGEITDPHNGRQDIRARAIRAIGVPEERFNEDGLRLLRGCRFACQLEFAIEEHTIHGMQSCASKIDHISAERIREELDKILESRVPSIGFLMMEQIGILKRVLPELARCRGVEQKGDHLFDVLDHSLYSCDAAPRNNSIVRLAALLHDLGKVDSRKTQADGEVIFHGHDENSAALSETILKRLKYSRAKVQAVVHLVRHHMFSYDDSWTDSAVRRFLRRVGPENTKNLFALRLADGYGVRKEQPSGLSVTRLIDRIDRVISSDDALSVKDLKVDGNDLAQRAGVPKGPEMGTVLSYLLEAVTDDPQLNDEKKLIELAENFYRQRMK